MGNKDKVLMGLSSVILGIVVGFIGFIIALVNMACSVRSFNAHLFAMGVVGTGGFTGLIGLLLMLKDWIN